MLCVYCAAVVVYCCCWKEKPARWNNLMPWATQHGLLFLSLPSSVLDPNSNGFKYWETSWFGSAWRMRIRIRIQKVKTAAIQYNQYLKWGRSWKSKSKAIFYKYNLLNVFRIWMKIILFSFFYSLDPYQNINWWWPGSGSA